MTVIELRNLLATYPDNLEMGFLTPDGFDDRIDTIHSIKDGYLNLTGFWYSNKIEQFIEEYKVTEEIAKSYFHNCDMNLYKAMSLYREHQKLKIVKVKNE